MATGLDNISSAVFKSPKTTAIALITYGLIALAYFIKDVPIETLSGWIALATGMLFTEDKKTAERRVIAKQQAGMKVG